MLFICIFTMDSLAYIFYGFSIAFLGSITPSFLNMTVVKYSLRSGKKPALYLVAGFATVLFFQANIGAYLSNILMKNSEYITSIQKVGTGILLLLSIHFLRLHLIKKSPKKKKDIKRAKAYVHGIGMSLLNTFAIPFYFTTISFLIGLGHFKYSISNGLIFSIGSTLGSFSMYAIYAILANKIEHRLDFMASRMNLILSGLTGLVGIGNLVYLLQS